MKQFNPIRISDYTLSKKQLEEQIHQKAELVWAESFKKEFSDCTLHVHKDDTRDSFNINTHISCQGSFSAKTYVRSCALDYKESLYDAYLNSISIAIRRLMRRWKDTKRQRVEDRIINISHEIGKITHIQRDNLDAGKVLKLKKLLQELHSLINRVVSKQRRLVRLISTKKDKNKVQDLRTHIRKIIRSLFKCLPDFSGCDEDARFTTDRTVKPHYSFYQSKNSCTTSNYYLARSIPLWNLRRTG